MATYSLPPIIDYSYPAFIEDFITLNFEYPLNFNKGSSNSTNVKMQYKIIDSTNTIITGKTGVLYNSELELWTTAVSIEMPKSLGLYKIQLRFWINESDYSEWSTICYTKKISAPTIKILEFPISSTQYTIPYESPTFTGQYDSEDEQELQYRFKLYYAAKGETVIGDTGWIKHVNGQPDIGLFPILLSDFTAYKIKYEIETVNGYINFIERNFLTAFYQIEDDIGLSLTAKNDYENGVINLHVTGTEIFAGNLILRRASEKTNYTNWEDLVYLHVLNEQPNIQYNDFTVEHGIQYRYGIQVINKENGVEYRSNMIRSIDANTKERFTMAQFEDIFLVSNGVQVKIKFNPKVTNFKRNLLESKQDTIGNKYPYILKNGNSNYFSFSLGGLISYFADDNNSDLFRESTATAISALDLINERTTNLTDRNIYNERQYRERIEQFLTNGETKLFKSPSEGNMLVYLMQVSLTPNDTVGRMIYSFTSTAYEIGSITNIDDLIKHKVLNKGEWLTVEEMGTRQYPFGNDVARTNEWIFTVNGTDSNLYEKITTKIENELVGICLPSVKYIKSITLQAVSQIGAIALLINGNEITLNYNNPIILDNIIDITDIQLKELKDKSDGQVKISDGIAIVSYNSVQTFSTIDNIGNKVTAITNIGQFFNWPIEEDTDLGALVKITYGLKKFFSFTYLSIRAAAGNDFELSVNGEKIAVKSDRATILNEPITQCIALIGEKDKVTFYADFIYNGYITANI